MKRMTASRLGFRIALGVAERLLLGTGTIGQGEINDLARRLAATTRYRQALAELGAAARAASADGELPRARQNFRQALKSDGLNKLVITSKYLRSLLNEGLEGDDAKFLTMINQLAVFKG